MHVSCVGAGYVGLVTSAGLASLGHRVSVFEADPDRLEALHQARVPFYEPGLPDVLAEVTAEGRLTFHGSIGDAVAGCDVVLIAVPTPPNGDGSADTSIVESVSLQMAPHLSADAILVIKSTVPVGTAARVERILRSAGSEASVASNPEFLREGSALADFLEPSRIVIGADSPTVRDAIQRMYASVDAPVIFTDPSSAELVKYAANAYLATRISFANEIARLCELTNTSYSDVLTGIGHDPRIGSHYMRPGPGFGGSCLPKDTRAMLAMAESLGSDMPQLRGTVEVNRRQSDAMLEKVRTAAGGDLNGKIVALWGLAFKAGSDDIRFSPAIALAEKVLAEGASVTAFDPIAVPVPDNVRRVMEPMEAVKEADVLVVATGWPEFRDLDLNEVRAEMRGVSVVDTRNLLDGIDVRRHGLDYIGVGEGRDAHFELDAAPAFTIEEPPSNGEVPFLDLGRLHSPIIDELTTAFHRVVAKSSFIGGREVEQFEDDLVEYVGSDCAIGVGSGTAALQLALSAGGIGFGDEVIVPANTFFATVEAVLATGAEPVLVDVLESTALMDPQAVEAAVTPRTAAIVPVHLYGQPADMDQILAIADRHGLFVLEDAAQALGARWNDQPIGTFGHAAAFSFYPGKNLGALGDAGAVVTNDKNIARQVKALRSHGELEKHRHEMAGFTERLDGLQAAFLSIKLRRLDDWQGQRDGVVERYRTSLDRERSVVPFDIDPRARHVHHLFVVQVPERDAVVARLRARNIGVGIHYPTPIHLQPAWTRRRPRECHEVAERLAGRIVSLPLFPGMTDGQVDHTVSAVVDAIGKGL